MQNLVTYQAYDINGYTFYTEEKDNKCDYQNSGVTSEFYTDDNVKERFYGRIEEIWEIDYYGEKVPMFRVRCAKNMEKGGQYFTTMVIPDAKSTKNATEKMSLGYSLAKLINAFYYRPIKAQLYCS